MPSRDTPSECAMKDLGSVFAQHGARSAESAVQRPDVTAPTSIERRSPVRQRSRGDRGRMSPSVIVHIVQAYDLGLLLFSGLLTAGMMPPLHWLRFDGSLFLATFVGSAVTATLFSRADVYLLLSLCQLGKQLQILTLPLLVGCSSMIVSLSLMRDVRPIVREWPFFWLAISAVLLIASRCCLTRMLRGWREAGRLARRVAVIGAGEFSREFIERLRSEPHAYTVVGLYDDRRSRIPGVQDGIKVRGTVRDLLERSRKEQIDLIVIALPLSAASRISMILDQIGSTVADLCLTTDFVGFRY